MQSLLHVNPISVIRSIVFGVGQLRATDIQAPHGPLVNNLANRIDIAPMLRRLGDLLRNGETEKCDTCFSNHGLNAAPAVYATDRETERLISNISRGGQAKN